MKIIAKNFLSWEYLEFDITDSVTLVDGWTTMMVHQKVQVSQR